MPRDLAYWNAEHHFNYRIGDVYLRTVDDGNPHPADIPGLQQYLADSGIELAGNNFELTYEETDPTTAEVHIRPDDDGFLTQVEPPTGANASTLINNNDRIEVDETIDGVRYRTTIQLGNRR